jgi:1-acyl-sn-glycerol-3-phosphate acyltransferase
LIELTERPVQFRGNALARALLRLAGWRLMFDGLPARQGVMVFYPHTSNWDFVIAMLTKWATGVPLSFIAKDTLFDVPLFGRWLRAIGGLPVVRGAPQGVVGQMAAELRHARSADRMEWLGLAPEGTRARTPGWRSGFYRIAVEADMPVGLAVMDWATRRVGLDSFWQPSGDLDADLALIADRIGGCRGLRPELAAPVRALDP